MNDKLDRFLNDEMDGSERKAFQREVNQDKKLRSTLNVHQAIDQTIGDSKELALEATLRSMRKTKTKPKVRTLWSALAAAASVVLLVSAFFLIRSFGNDSLLNGPGAGIYEPGIMQETQLSSESKQLLNSGQKAYNQGEYELALQDLSAYLEANPNHEKVRIFAAKSALMTHHINDALGFLSYFDENDSLLKGQAAWLKAVCYTEVGDNYAAKEILEELASGTDLEFAEKAKKLLQKL